MKKIICVCGLLVIAFVSGFSFFSYSIGQQVITRAPDFLIKRLPAQLQVQHTGINSCFSGLQTCLQAENVRLFLGGLPMTLGRVEVRFWPHKPAEMTFLSQPPNNAGLTLSLVGQTQDSVIDVKNAFLTEGPFNLSFKGVFDFKTRQIQGNALTNGFSSWLLPQLLPQAQMIASFLVSDKAQSFDIGTHHNFVTINGIALFPIPFF